MCFKWDVEVFTHDVTYYMNTLGRRLSGILYVKLSPLRRLSARCNVLCVRLLPNSDVPVDAMTIDQVHRCRIGMLLEQYH